MAYHCKECRQTHETNYHDEREAERRQSEKQCLWCQHAICRPRDVDFQLCDRPNAESKFGVNRKRLFGGRDQ